MDAVDYINPERVSGVWRPSGRQIFKLAAVALTALDRDWPSSRREATELINELQLEVELQDFARDR